MKIAVPNEFVSASIIGVGERYVHIFKKGRKANNVIYIAYDKKNTPQVVDLILSYEDTANPIANLVFPAAHNAAFRAIDASACPILPNESDCMFASLSYTTAIDINIMWSSIKSLQYTFHGCTSLTSIDLKIPETSTPSLYAISGFCAGCSELTSIDMSNINLEGISYFTGAFRDCPKLNTIIAKNCSDGTIEILQSMLRREDISDKVKIVR